MTASFEGHDDIVRMLIKAKARVNTQEEVHVTSTIRKCTAPLGITLIATSCSCTTCIYTIHVGELCFCSQRGWTALHLAAQEGKVDVVKLLTDAKAYVNMQNKVHTLCHVWSNIACHVLSNDMGESMYTECCVHA